MARRIKASHIKLLAQTLAKKPFTSPYFVDLNRLQTANCKVRDMAGQLAAQFATINNSRTIDGIPPKISLGITRPGPTLCPRHSAERLSNIVDLIDNDVNLSSRSSSSSSSLRRKACPKTFSQNNRLCRCIIHNLKAIDDEELKEEEQPMKFANVPDHVLEKFHVSPYREKRSGTLGLHTLFSGHIGRLAKFLGTRQHRIAQYHSTRRVHVTHAEEYRQTSESSDAEEVDKVDSSMYIHRVKRTSSNTRAQALRNRRMINVARCGQKARVTPDQKIPVPSYEIRAENDTALEKGSRVERRTIRREDDQKLVPALRQPELSSSEEELPEQPRGIVRRQRLSGSIGLKGGNSKFPDGGVAFKCVSPVVKKEVAKSDTEQEHSYIDALWHTRPTLAPVVMPRSSSVTKLNDKNKMNPNTGINYKYSGTQKMQRPNPTVDPRQQQHELTSIRSIESVSTQAMQNRHLHEVRHAERNEHNQRASNMKRQRVLAEQLAKEQINLRLQPPASTLKVDIVEKNKARNECDGDSDDDKEKEGANVVDAKPKPKVAMGNAFESLERHEQKQREFKQREAKQRDLNRIKQERMRDAMNTRSRSALNSYQKDQSKIRTPKYELEDYEPKKGDYASCRIGGGGKSGVSGITDSTKMESNSIYLRTIREKRRDNDFRTDMKMGAGIGGSASTSKNAYGSLSASTGKSASINSSKIASTKSTSTTTSKNNNVHASGYEKRTPIKPQTDMKRENAFETRALNSTASMTKPAKHMIVNYKGVTSTPKSFYNIDDQPEPKRRTFGLQTQSYRKDTPCMDSSTAKRYAATMVGPLQTLVERNEVSHMMLHRAGLVDREFQAVPRSTLGKIAPPAAATAKTTQNYRPVDGASAAMRNNTSIGQSATSEVSSRMLDKQKSFNAYQRDAVNNANVAATAVTSKYKSKIPAMPALSSSPSPALPSIYGGKASKIPIADRGTKKPSGYSGGYYEGQPSVPLNAGINVAYMPGALEARSLGLLGRRDNNNDDVLIKMQERQERMTRKLCPESFDDDEPEQLEPHWREMSPLQQQDMWQKRLRDQQAREELNMAKEKEADQIREDLSAKWHKIHLKEEED